MTAYFWSALQSHPWWALVIFLLVFGFLAVVYLLAYHGSGPQKQIWIDGFGEHVIDPTHNGPYRPPLSTTSVNIRRALT